MAFTIYRIYNNPMPYFIEFIDVEKSFGEMKVLDGISFGVEQGETFAILGPSGAGKTVTLTLAVGLDRKSTRLNSSHSQISYAVFCLKKKKKIQIFMHNLHTCAK